MTRSPTSIVLRPYHSVAIVRKLGYIQPRCFPWRYWEKESDQ